ncbi:MAG TPA: hypothetical protein VHN11_23440 [Xanthobacteraceae bacterium]|jgi:hypothetical protein|nr:hypothetical protein [Xanthobacteraceae bacterium]
MMTQTLRRAAPILSFVCTLVFGAGAALADCKSDLTASAQTLQGTQAAVVQVAGGPEAGKCDAFRRYHQAVVGFRAVMIRCDKGKKTAEHVNQLDTSIGDIKKNAPKGCKI